jgi:hypothetical protein
MLHFTLASYNHTIYACLSKADFNGYLRIILFLISLTTQKARNVAFKLMQNHNIEAQAIMEGRGVEINEGWQKSLMVAHIISLLTLSVPTTHGLRFCVLG